MKKLTKREYIKNLSAFYSIDRVTHQMSLITNNYIKSYVWMNSFELNQYTEPHYVDIDINIDSSININITVYLPIMSHGIVGDITISSI